MGLFLIAHRHPERSEGSKVFRFAQDDMSHTHRHPERNEGSLALLLFKSPGKTVFFQDSWGKYLRHNTPSLFASHSEEI